MCEVVDFPLVPVITTFVESGEYLSMACESASEFASSILSVNINGKLSLSAVSIAPSFGVCVMRHAIFLLNAI